MASPERDVQKMLDELMLLTNKIVVGLVNTQQTLSASPGLINVSEVAVVKQLITDCVQHINKINTSGEHKIHNSGELTEVNAHNVAEQLTINVIKSEPKVEAVQKDIVQFTADHFSGKLLPETESELPPPLENPGRTQREKRKSSKPSYYIESDGDDDVTDDDYAASDDFDDDVTYDVTETTPRHMTSSGGGSANGDVTHNVTHNVTPRQVAPPDGGPVKRRRGRPKGSANPDYKCFQCGKVFRFIRPYIRHEAEHQFNTETNRYQCRICGEASTETDPFIDHCIFQHYKSSDQKHGGQIVKKPRPSEENQTATGVEDGRGEEDGALDSDFPSLQLETDKPPQYTCYQCEAKFKGALCLIKHEISHQTNADSSYTCRTCRKHFTDKSELITHSFAHLPPGAIKKSHKKQEPGNAKKSPKIKKSDKTQKVTTEEGDETGEKVVRVPSFKCHLCDEKYMQAKTLAYHEISHIREADGQITCWRCGEKFSSDKLYVKHSRQHALDERANNTTCKDCGREFAERREMESHHRKEHLASYQKAPCEICGKLLLMRAMEEHLQTHAPGGLQKRYICHVCGMSYRYKGGLNRHARTHQASRMYRCQECPKAFTTNASLRQHMYSHSRPTDEEMPFRCDICGKGFVYRENMMAHHDVHTGKKRFKCAICNQPFRQRTYLKNHMLIHTGEKPHVCEFCGKKFRTKVNLSHHMNVHLEDKLHTCDRCGKTFKTGTNMRKHKKLVHDAPMLFPCRFCEKMFNRKYNTLAHERKCPSNPQPGTELNSGGRKGEVVNVEQLVVEDPARRQHIVGEDPTRGQLVVEDPGRGQHIVGEDPARGQHTGKVLPLVEDLSTKRRGASVEQEGEVLAIDCTKLFP